MSVDPQFGPTGRPGRNRSGVDVQSADITHLLTAAGDGDAGASGGLFTRVYDELRAIAGRQMGDERRGHTLGATALVHEVYVRLLHGAPLRVSDRAGFFHAAAEAMRRILIEHARQRGRAKRVGQRRRMPLDVVDLAADEHLEEILAVDEALRRLGEQDAQVAEVVRLRFFAGLSVEEVAEALNSSPRSVARDWAYARAWLYRAMSDGSD